MSTASHTLSYWQLAPESTCNAVTIADAFLCTNNMEVLQYVLFAVMTLVSNAASVLYAVPTIC